MSILVAFIWGIVLFLIGDSVLVNILPFVLLLDATIMSLMYIGAEMYFEKSESTISTMLVTPVTNNELVLSKAFANTIHNLISSLLIVFVFYMANELNYINGLGLHLLLLLVGITVTTMSFTIFGLVLSYYQKDFTDMLVDMFIIVIVLMIPSILLMFGIISGEFWENVLLINPLQAAQEIIKIGIHPDSSTVTISYKYVISLIYILFSGIAVYKFLAIPKFQDYAIKQSGV